MKTKGSLLSVKYYLANHLLSILCYREWQVFNKSAALTEKSQKKILLKILKMNEKTDFGRKHGFSAINNVASFRANVPLSTYNDYSSEIEMLSCGQKNVLTRDKVLLFEPSSGSASATKLIPYTKTLKRQFQKAILPWLYDILTKNIGVAKGSAYWSITPIGKISRERKNESTPVGFDKDAEYFGPILKRVLNLVIAVPADVGMIEDVDVFRYATLFYLLKEKKLAFISVWDPTFLSFLFEPLPRFAPSIIGDIDHGTLTLPSELPDELKSRLTKKISADKGRAAELRKIFDLYNRSLIIKNRLYKSIWPGLSLISCWGDGKAANNLFILEEMFTGVKIQPKGLLATEGIVSFPLTGKTGGILAVNSHFFEFLVVDGLRDCGRYQDIRLAHQLEEGKLYYVIITTGGGLYRYQLNDIIKVVGFENGCPMIRFISKGDKVSDLFGEKLNEHHVAEVLKSAFEAYSIKPDFFMVAPEEKTDSKYCYSLFLQGKKYNTENIAVCGPLIRKIEEGLKKNFHYEYCRKIGQLSQLNIFLIDPNSSPEQSYIMVQSMNGKKIGNIKSAVLDPMVGWSRHFQGTFI